MLFAPIFTKGIKAKPNALESESDFFPQNEGKFGKSELTPVEKALTNCAMDQCTMQLSFSKNGNRRSKTDFHHSTHFPPVWLFQTNYLEIGL